MQTFRRRVFDMSHVEIETAAIEKKPSIARWFLVIPIMQIDRAGVGFSEEIIFNLGRPELRIDVWFFFTQKTAVFGLDSNDPIHRQQLRTESQFGYVEKARLSFLGGCSVRCPQRTVGGHSLR